MEGIIYEIYLKSPIEKLDNLVNAIRGISPIKASNIPEVQ